MKKRVYVQRQVQVWIEEKYDIENDDQETLEDLAENKDLKYEWLDCEVLWESQEDLGKVDILNSDGVVIYSNYNDV
jgi:hypothetical protein